MPQAQTATGYLDHLSSHPHQYLASSHQHQYHKHILNPEDNPADAEGEVVALIDGLLAGLRAALHKPQRYEGVQQDGRGQSPNGAPQYANARGISNLGRALARLPASQIGMRKGSPPCQAGSFTPPSVLAPPTPPRTAPIAKATVSARYINPSEPGAHRPHLRKTKQRRDLRDYLEERFGSVARGFDTLVRSVLPDAQDQNERMTYKLNPEEFNNALRRVGYEQARCTKKDSGWWDGLVEAIDMDGDELISIQDAIDALLISLAD